MAKQYNDSSIGIFIFVGILALVLWFLSGYHSINLFSDEKIEERIIKFIRENYSDDTTLELVSKEPLKLCKVEGKNGCDEYYGEENIYKYVYTAHGSKEYKVEYITPRVVKFKIYFDEIGVTY